MGFDMRRGNIDDALSHLPNVGVARLSISEASEILSFCCWYSVDSTNGPH